VPRLVFASAHGHVQIHQSSVNKTLKLMPNRRQIAAGALKKIEGLHEGGEEEEYRGYTSHFSTKTNLHTPKYKGGSPGGCRRARVAKLEQKHCGRI
jgi:hypothetical protein